jgi:hypothetical protein
VTGLRLTVGDLLHTRQSLAAVFFLEIRAKSLAMSLANTRLFGQKLLWHQIIRLPIVRRINYMNEMNYPWGDVADDLLHAQADIGECLLDEEAFQYRPTQDELNKLVLEGISLLFIDSLKGK